MKVPFAASSRADEVAERVRRVIDQLSGTAGEIAELTRCVAVTGRELAAHASGIRQRAAIHGVEIKTTAQSMTDMHDAMKVLGADMGALSATIETGTAATLEMASTTDEIAQEMAGLSASAAATHDGMDRLAESIRQLEQTVDDLSRASRETASVAGSIDASTTQIRTTIHKTIELSQRVTDNAQSGQESVDQTIAAIHRIKSYAEEVSDTIHRLQRKTDDIGKILVVIDDVAEQTNLLALNAAIIAAQAGEHGKGFAVVAGEIKELAERTATSTKEIHDIISALQTEGASAVRTIQGGSARVSDGVRLSNGAKDALGRILESARESTERVMQMARETDQQTAGVQRVTGEMQKVNQKIQQIVGVARQQTQLLAEVERVGEQMRSVTQHVTRATVEQAKGNRQISEVIELANRRVKDVLEFVKQRRAESDEVLQALLKIGRIDLENETAIERTAHAVDDLLRVATRLEENVVRLESTAKERA